MNQASTSSWSQSIHDDPMVSASGDDEFSNFLEFGLNFSAFDTANHDSFPENGASVMDTNMEQSDVTTGLEMGQNSQPHHYAAGPEQADLSPMGGHDKPQRGVVDMNLQAQLLRQQQQRQQMMQSQEYQRQTIIPPTPNSLDLHGGAARYYQHLDAQGQAIYERYQQMKEDQIAFTPLVSPAVTPLDSQFRMPEYTIPGEYFSPLTSPALEARNSNGQKHVYSSAQSSDTGVTTSPIDMNIDLSSLSTPSTPATARKPRRKLSASTRNPPRTIRRSPIIKPQGRWKQASGANILPKDVAHAQDGSISHKPPSGAKRTASARLSSSYESSGPDSVSPEPISEALMPPPAAPRSASAGKSPFIAAQQTSPSLTGNEPATPATLMRLQNQPRHPTGTSVRTPDASSTALHDLPDEVMEDIMLPESATISRPVLPPIDTARANDEETTPTLSAKKTPKFGPGSTPGTTASNSVAPSPQLRGLTSPTGSTIHKRNEAKSGGGRGSKKRQSVSSSQVSPALRPKISPSIKPLIREGAPVSAETSALYLASKSNYQNILEGTHLPGVSYPEALAENLSSKRTSHKIAEQGRRNRINTALKEIESLLPSMSNGNGNGKDAGKVNKERSDSNSGDNNTTADGLQEKNGGAWSQSNSKANTVEMAIVYIKALQKELTETKDKLEIAEKKLADGGAGGSQSSD